MANSKSTDLASLTAEAGDEIPVNRAGSDGKVTAGDIAALAGAAIDVDDLGDAVITSPADNEVLAYDNGSTTWINQTAAEAGLAAASHTHTEADITDLGPYREILTANRTYYVRTGGSDSNTGLVNDDAGAFATVQKAWDTIGPLDLGDFDIVIQIADGTYEMGAGDYWLDAVRNWPRGGSGGEVTIQGNTGDKTAVQVNCNNADYIAEILSWVPDICVLNIEYITFANADNANDGGFNIGSSQVFFSNVGTTVGASTYHFIIGQESYVGFFGANTIASGGVNYVLQYEQTFCAWNASSLTATGTCTFSDAFARVKRNSFHIVAVSTTFTGTYAGVRFIVEEASVITRTSGTLSLTFFPGDTAGIIRDGGIYSSISGTSYFGTDNIQFPTGGVLDFGSADVTVTHSANTLTFAGASTGYVFNTGPTTAGAALRETVVALSDGATPALDASLGNIFYLDAGGNRTIAVPSNAVNGQKIIIRHFANGAARTLALNTGAGGFRFGTDITALTETGSGLMDYIGCIYNGVDSFWDVVAYTKGF
jgi:hypothetical protein